ncbi:MAG: hypothetical protein COA58_01405 [Bacteroidetes bacterium]|nr:MAG: hypothetical protein COA58_01405 [Bacteroidota bacterium]
MGLKSANKRHIAKTLTWRVIATTTTFILSYLFFRDDAHAIQKASGVAGTEFFLKMFLYYGHERLWYKTKFGIEKRDKSDEQSV